MNKFTSADLAKAEYRIKKFLFGKMNEETYEVEGGLTKEVGLPEDTYKMGGNVEFFSNAHRGDPNGKLGKGKVGGELSKKTKAKSPFEAVEMVWLKQKKGEQNKRVLSGIKIDSYFAINQFDELCDYLREKWVWLKMFQDFPEDKVKGRQDFKFRFGGKEHQEEMGKKFPEQVVLTTTVEKADNYEFGTWGFELARQERKSGFGGGSKTSYKKQYEELLEFVKGGVSADEVAEFLTQQSPKSSRAPSPEPEEDQEVQEEEEDQETTQEVPEDQEEEPKKSPFELVNSIINEAVEQKKKDKRRKCETCLKKKCVCE